MNFSHTFVICAYKESEHLEKCIKSLQKQTLKTNIKMVTSTPNDHIRGLAEKYGIELFVLDATLVGSDRGSVVSLFYERRAVRLDHAPVYGCIEACWHESGHYGASILTHLFVSTVLCDLSLLCQGTYLVFDYCLYNLWNVHLCPRIFAIRGIPECVEPCNFDDIYIPASFLC